jgi:hypothetical protein
LSRTLPICRVRAVNWATESDNKIHDDRVAAAYGFRGGLVPGVGVYGYMTVPIVEFAPEWLERGTMQVRFYQPVYDGDQTVVRAEVSDDGSIRVTAEQEDGTVCGIGTASIQPAVTPPEERYPEHPLPQDRPEPSRETLIPGTPLGTVVDKLEVAEPRQVLQFSNEMLARNFKLGPWIHAASEITNWSAARSGEEISARGRIHDRFDRKGHEFVVIEVMLIGHDCRLVQTVRHTAIYRPRMAASAL